MGKDHDLKIKLHKKDQRSRSWLWSRSYKYFGDLLHHDLNHFKNVGDL